jgi:hypothetical protein
MRVLRGTSIQLALEVALASAGAYHDDNGNAQTAYFYQQAVWLSVVQAF